MSAPAAESRFTLRDLPIPAKLVATCFLLSVGLGYTTAMVQLHFQDSKSGEPMPTLHDVVLKFTGKKWFDTEPPRPVSKFTQLITASSGTFGSNGTMLPAFFEKDPAFNKALRGGIDATKLRGEREGERDALVLWANAPPDERKAAYEADGFVVAADKMPRAITGKFVTGDAVKVKTLIDARCANCHRNGGDDSKAAAFPLDTYDAIAKYLAVPASAPFPPGGGWVRVEEPISLEKLTQSTHAHLLSFAVLFSLTGLVFAFSSYPTVVRCIVSPLVLLAIVTDVTFWWVARLSDGYGVYFAMGIMGTGGVAGLGLTAQIVLGVWNMYGPKGKLVLALLFLAAGALGGLIMQKIVMPGLEAKKAEAVAKVRAEAEKKPDEKKEPPKKEPEKKVEDTNPPEKKDPDPKPEDKKGPDLTQPPKKGTEVIVPKLVGGVSVMDRALEFPVKDADGKEIPLLKLPFDKGGKKNMVRAFFDKDAGDYAAAVKAKDQEALDKLTPERHAELAALREWMQLPEAQRKKTFDDDAFPMPAELAKKPFTADYVKDGKVMIKAIVTDRCVRCHDTEEKTTFNNYATLRPYLEPKPPEKK
ncbi:hypothetical protein [Gemmata sp.]|uniref:hypothetical protein n=1 Tax=Gemmata sp. TaxID=1914242 RepID=UPI003F7176B7